MGELRSREEARGLTKGQARYRVRKIQATRERGRKRTAYAIRCLDDTYAVYSYPAPRPVNFV